MTILTTKKGAWRLPRSLCCVLALLVATLLSVPTQAAQGAGDKGHAAALALYNAGNHKKARPAFEAACKAGNGESCFSAGYMWSKGEGGKADDTKARGFYTSGCKLGDGGACNNLANFMDKGRGGPLDTVQALATYEKSCAGNNQLGCFQAAKVLAYGDSAGKVKIDATRAQGFYVRACDLNYTAACYIAASNVRAGRGVAADEAAANQLFRRACTLGDKEACALFGIAK
jgi:TPR repeat protein